MDMQLGSSSSSPKSPSSMDMGFLVTEALDFIQVQDEALSQWEFVNILDSKSEQGDEDSVKNGFGSWDSSFSWPGSPKIIALQTLNLNSPDVDVKNPPDFDHGCNYQFNDGHGKGNPGGEEDSYYNYNIDEDEDEDEDEHWYDRFDLDDELVPWSVSAKLGRQRIRKLGKRGFSKMHNSKRSPYLFVRPGCVRGKHGLGLKHKII